ncbi:MAG TPA: 50S ribosomal protein L31 [Synergistales bacterium]|jgi:large subunit ribosomal protein L31|nr:50S ribosomal protein L31 [Synergistaceae bacterium]HPA58793.1 50S ribosomal protein L31 [Synergistales bacterium]HQO83264.1 50S ribosomal protein L31 [Synergistales bacterium]HQQ10578.1 50S ribosomal protein L31 [Synergistales bacterium]
MKKDIHPEYRKCKVSCACGNSFETGSTVEEIKVAVCSACHPVYTGKRGTRVSEAGRVEKFQKKYAGTRFGKPEEPQETQEEKKD